MCGNKLRRRGAQGVQPPGARGDRRRRALHNGVRRRSGRHAPRGRTGGQAERRARLRQSTASHRRCAGDSTHRAARCATEVPDRPVAQQAAAQGVDKPRSGCRRRLNTIHPPPTQGNHARRRAGLRTAVPRPQARPWQVAALRSPCAPACAISPVGLRNGRMKAARPPRCEPW
jgi:hypothetical protein